MLDARFIVNNPDLVQRNCDARRVHADVAAIVELHKARTAVVTEIDHLRHRQNEIAQAMKGKLSPQERAPLVEEGRALKVRVPDMERDLAAREEALREAIARLPNLTHPAVPAGGEEDSAELRRWGTPRALDYEARGHVEIGQALDLVDFESGAAVAGQKFYFLRNEAVFLELGLVRYALDALAKRGFTPVITPDLARPDVLEGIGFQPRGPESQVYNVEGHDLCLVGTAEITIGGMLRGKILDEKDLPIRIAGLSHCFRTEAGAHGRESRGLYRVHQFTKVEMFAFSTPEQSEALHDELLAIEEELFQGLEVPYRVLDIASGDLGGPAYRKFDIEAWMPGRGAYGEVTSTSNCTDYQARRLDIRYRPGDGSKPRYVHTLNGTAVAISRGLISVLENGQQADGSVTLPAKLVPYCGFDRIGPRQSAVS